MSGKTTTAAGRGPIERVIVLLDTASEPRTAIDTAARLAARVQAPLHAIFVEDEDLLALAGLPFTRQTTLGAAAEDLTTSHIELHLQVAAGRARGELLAAARRHRVEASFEIVRGASDSVLATASERDLVVAGGLTRPIGAHFRMTCRWWSALEAARGPLLLARHAWSTSGSVVLLLRDRDAASARLLEAATQAAQAADRVLTVICPPAVADVAGLDEWIADRLAGQPVRLHIETGPAEPAALNRRIGELDCRLLAVEAGRAEGGGEPLRDLFERFTCDILVVR
jgi:hypothetical protein